MKRTTIIGVWAAAGCFVAVSSSSAWATGNDYSIGADLGIASVGNSNGTNVAYGVQAGWRPSDPYNFNAFFNYANSSTTVAGTNANVSTSWTLVGVGIDDAILGSVPGLQIGLRGGLQWQSSSGSLGAQSNTVVILGPKVSYDFPVLPSVTLGAEGTYFWALSNAGSNIFTALVVAKLWF